MGLDEGGGHDVMVIRFTSHRHVTIMTYTETGGREGGTEEWEGGREEGREEGRKEWEKGRES